MVSHVTTQHSTRGEGRFHPCRVHRKCPHNAHRRAGIGGRGLWRNIKNNENSYYFSVPVSAIDKISPSQPTHPTYYLASPLEPYILLWCLNGGANRYGGGSIISPVVLYPRVPQCTIPAAGVGPPARRVISFLCRHPYRKTTQTKTISSRPFHAGPAKRTRVHTRWAPCVGVFSCTLGRPSRTTA